MANSSNMLQLRESGDICLLFHVIALNSKTLKILKFMVFEESKMEQLFLCFIFLPKIYFERSIIAAFDRGASVRSISGIIDPAK